MTQVTWIVLLALLIVLVAFGVAALCWRGYRQQQTIQSLQQQQYWLQAQLQHTPDFSLLLDHHGRTVCANKPIPDSWQSISCFEGAPLTPNCLARWLEQLQASQQCVYWTCPRTAQGEQWRCCLTPIQGANYFVLRVEEVSDRLMLAAAHQQRYQALERQSQARSRFLASMSHEIRTPMTGLLGTVSLLEQTQLDEEQQQLLQTLQHSAEHLLTIINDILDLSKIEAGKLPINQQAFDPRQLLNELLQSVEGFSAGKSIALSVSVASSVASRLSGDPVRIRQIIMNFLTNAIKFTEQGSIDVELKPVAENSNTLVFSVTDSGDGIGATQALHLFEEYAQGQQATNVTSGTGLGLHICKRLAKLMNGRVGVISMPGEGASFWLELTLLPVQEAVPDKADKSPEQLDDDSDLEGARILLAEDNLVNQKVAIQMLERLGCHVVLAANGEEAVHHWQNQPVDLVLMDCHMPVMDGIEATRQIRALEQDGHTPIVALSADVMGEQRRACEEAGMDGYLSKPVRIQELRQQLPKFMQLARQD
ncbi:hybrid sensor histidine kinase/response regulator [Bacterioplanes sanyensis]|uniref:Sensory/regulatory protein RpfC n=1 Tax=Bacterioplanes sanyensis TaxID=1249553 RepID=A0A222FPZ0_9GAMM|nr:response regulator [Bacterioplanes sanyensis]ASP40313.1 hybrid sensor histidine kinase/response regulator [Bacterioplanes sanyensis]